MMRLSAAKPARPSVRRPAFPLFTAALALSFVTFVPLASAQQPPAANPLEARDAHGLTPLVAAATNGDTDTVRSLLAAGAKIDGMDSGGRTALIAAVQAHQPDAAKVLVAAGANLNREARFLGSALSIAENDGDAKTAAWLLAAGAHSTGKSVGDTVCVRPWGGEGYCGTVKTFSVRSVQIDVTRLVGCAGGCPARQECSASNPVGGVNGLHVGEAIAVPSWCLTQTGVKQ